MALFTSHSVDSRMARAATPGFPVIARRRLRAAGVHRDSVRPRLRDGRLTALWGDTFLIGLHDIDDVPRELVRRAAVASVEPNSMLAGVSAIERHTGWARFDRAVHVISDRWHVDVPEHGVVFRRTAKTIDPRDVVMVEGIPTAAPLLAILQAARDLTPHQATNALAALEYRTSLRAEQVGAEADSASRLLGAPVLRRATELLRAGSAGTKSRSEDRLLPHVTARYAEPLVNVRGSAGLTDYEPDMLWLDARCIIEVDGGHHDRDPVVRAADRERDAILRAAGWMVVRIPWLRVWRDLPRVLDEIDVAFADRRGFGMR